jgi:hypothetical protein
MVPLSKQVRCNLLSSLLLWHILVPDTGLFLLCSFFLPSQRFELSFVHDGPASQLPQLFNASIGTAGIPPHMNDQNREEATRYIDPSRCDYFVELVLEVCIPRVDNSLSPSFPSLLIPR